MQFVFLKNNLAEIVSKAEYIEWPSSAIKKLGPYLLSALFNDKTTESRTVLSYLAKNVDRNTFVKQLAQDPQAKNWRVNSKKSLESLALSVIAGNPNIIDHNYLTLMHSDGIVLSEALSHAYTLVIQKTMNWELTSEKQTLQRLNQLLATQKVESAKININTLYQKQFLSDLGYYYPEYLVQSQGRIFATELPIDYFVGEIKSEYRDFFLEANQLIDLKIKDQVFLFQFTEEFEAQPVKALLWRYVKLKRLQELYPTLKVVWCNRGVQKSEILEAIGV